MITPFNGRGLQPKVRTTTTHLWTMDVVASPDLVAGGTALTNPGGAGAPTSAVGRIGNANLFNGTTNFLTGPTGESANFQTAYTIEAWIHPLTSQGSNSGVITYSNTAGAGGVLAANTQFELQYNVDRTLTWRWERGAGVDIEQTTTATLPIYQWAHVGFVRGPTYGGGVCDVSLYINGAFVESWTGQLESEGGTNASVIWNVGTLGAGGVWGGYINTIAHHQEVLTEADIRESFRRGSQWTPGNFDTQVKVVADQLEAIGAGFVLPTPLTLTNFLGRDWVESVELSKNVDASCATATLRVFRDVFNQTFSPDIADTPVNLFDNNPASPGYLGRPNPGAPGPTQLTFTPAIDNWRGVEIFVARVPMGQAPSAVDWQSVFKGRIDKFDWAGDIVQITMRDQAAALEDTWCEEENEPYASVAVPVPMVTAINTMIGALWLSPRPAVGPTLVAPVDPATNLTVFISQFSSFADLVLTLADQIGWSLGYRWNPEAAEWQWTLFDPDRLRITVDGTFEPEDVLQFQALSQDITTVRNVIRIGYKDANGAQKTEIRQEFNLPPAYSTANTERYGRRFWSISQKATPNIDNQAEAWAMADSILYDVMAPYADKSVTMKCFFEAEVGDRYSFQPDGVHYSTAYTGAVVSYSHKFSNNNQATTVLQLRGRPASAWKRHIDKGGGARTGVRVPPGSLETVTTSVGPMITEIPFQSLLEANVPGGTVTDASVITPNQYFTLHPDYDNNIFPGWSLDAGSSWGSGKDVYWSTGDSESGDRCLTLLTTGASVSTVTFQPIISTRCVQLTVRWNGTSVGDILVGTINWYDRALALLSSSVVITKGPTVVGVFQTDIGVAAPPANARFARLTLSQGAGVPGVITIDRVSMTPVAPAFYAYVGASQTALVAGVTTVMALDDTLVRAYDYCGDFNNATHVWTVPESGDYRFSGSLLVSKNGSGGTFSDASVDIFISGVFYQNVAAVQYVTEIATTYQIPWTLAATGLVGGDAVTFRATCLNSNYNIVAGTLSFVAGWLVERGMG